MLLPSLVSPPPQPALAPPSSALWLDASLDAERADGMEDGVATAAWTGSLVPTRVPTTPMPAGASAMPPTLAALLSMLKPPSERGVLAALRVDRALNMTTPVADTGDMATPLPLPLPLASAGRNSGAGRRGGGPPATGAVPSGAPPNAVRAAGGGSWWPRPKPGPRCWL